MACHKEEIPYDVYYDEKHDCIIGSFVGLMDFSALKKYLTEIVRIALKHKCKQFYNDLRNAELYFAIINIYKIPAMLLAAGIDQSWKIAGLVSKNSMKFQFLGMVASQKGFQVKIFTDPDEATNWLGQLLMKDSMIKRTEESED